jgi:hypothetical protein
MMNLIFYRTGNKVIRGVGPVPFVKVVGGSLCVGPDGSRLAEYHDGVWRVGEQEAPRYIVSGSGPLRLEGERPGSPVCLGEYAQLEFIDGALYTRPGGALLARYDEARIMWYVFQDKSFCETLSLEESHSQRPSERPSAKVASQAKE